MGAGAGNKISSIYTFTLYIPWANCTGIVTASELLANVSYFLKFGEICVTLQHFKRKLLRGRDKLILTAVLITALSTDGYGNSRELA